MFHVNKTILQKQEIVTFKILPSFKIMPFTDTCCLFDPPVKRFYLNVLADGEQKILVVGESVYHSILKCLDAPQPKLPWCQRWWNWLRSWFIKSAESEILIRTTLHEKGFYQFEVIRK